MSVTTILGSLLDGYAPSIILAASAVLLLIWQRLSIQMDPREPPLCKPTIPYIGHIIGVLKDQIYYYDRFRGNPICTIPLINAKVYVITQPALIQAVFRSTAVSFEPLMAEFAGRMLGLNDEAMIPLRDIPEDHKATSFNRVMTAEIHNSMLGQNLQEMNSQALRRIAFTINRMGATFEPDSLYLWLRTTLTMATGTALFGAHNPMIFDPSLVDSLWDFDAGIFGLLLGIFPSITVPKAYKGRVVWQSALRKYYNAGYDSWPGVAQLTKGHANQFRNYNIKPDLIGDFELSLIHVSTLNAIPTLFWNLLHIASDPVLTEEIRQELLSIIRPGIPLSNGKRGIEIDITKFEDSCPLLVSSYRETIRLANGQLSTRRVVRDTMISDGKNSYLLKKGADVMMPSAVTHLSTDIWGPNAHKFDATRFMTKATTDEKEKEEERERRRAYFPFGGGKHLCPGRNFASAEILGTITALLLGFDIKSAEGGLIQVPELRRARIGEAVGKPQLKGQHIGARLERRAGWEDVVWKFVC